MTLHHPDSEPSGIDNRYLLKVIGAAFSHDLRSPTNAAWSCIHYLHESIDENRVYADLPERARELFVELEDLKSESEHLLKVLSGCLQKIRFETDLEAKFIEEEIIERLGREFSAYNSRIRDALAEILSLRGTGEFAFLKNQENKKHWSSLDRIEKRSSSMLNGLREVFEVGQSKEDPKSSRVLTSFHGVVSAKRRESQGQRLWVNSTYLFHVLEDVSIQTKPVYLRILLNNLIENALRYAVPNDEVELYLGIQRIDFQTLKLRYPRELKPYSASERWVEIHIGNRFGSKPIDEETAETMFDLFKTENKEYDDKFGGAGVGLAVSRLLCFLMRGIIFLNRRREDVTDFVVLLPERPEWGIGKSQLIEHERLSKLHKPQTR